MKITSATVAVFLFAIWNLQVHAESTLQPFSNRIQIPDVGVDCPTEAAGVALRFQKATGTPVTSAVCTPAEKISDRGHEYQIFSININYMAAFELKPYLASYSADAFLDQPLGQDGVFTDYVTCLKSLANQKKAFEANTQLILVGGQCEVSPSFEKHYLLTLESFGDPKQRLFTFKENDNFYVDPRIHSAVLGKLVQAGAHISLDLKSQIFYYSAQPLLIFSNDLGLFDSEDQCAMQMNDAETIFRGSVQPAVTILCAKAFAATSPQSALTAIGLDRGQENTETATTRYTSLEECLQDKSRVLSNYIAGGRKVLGGICHSADGARDFVIDVYMP